MLAPGPRAGAAIRYEEQEIRSADPIALVVKIHDIALASVAKARSAIASGDPAAKGAAVNRLGRSLDLLRSSLSMEAGGKVARDLDRLYDYLLRRVTEGHLRSDDRAFAEVAAHLGELAAAWRESASRRSEPVAAAGGR